MKRFITLTVLLTLSSCASSTSKTTVVMLVDVKKDGNIENIRILESLPKNKEIEKSATEAVKGYYLKTNGKVIKDHKIEIDFDS